MEYNAVIFDQSMYFLPIFFITFALCLVLFFGTYINTQKGIFYLDVQHKVLALVEILFLLSIMLLFINGWNLGFGFANTFSTHPSTILVQIVICSFSLGITLISRKYLHQEKINIFEYHILVVLSSLGLICLVASETFMSVFLSIELQSLSFYVLASIFLRSDYSTEAGLKYFVLGAVATCFMLFGFSCIYGFTGSCNFDDIFFILYGSNEILSNSSFIVLTASASLIIASLLFKIAAVPFHFWAPDVYEGSPTGVTAFFATVPKIAIFFLLLKLILGPFYSFAGSLSLFVLICSIMSIVLGTFSALYQRKLKRMMAYSAITHTGFLLLGCSCLTSVGVEAVFTYLLFYNFMSLAMFSILLASQTLKKKWFVYISDFCELPKTNGVFAITSVLILLSMAGVPPLAGFFGKLFIFASAINADLLLPSVIAILLSSIACVYYLRIFKISYFDTATRSSVIWLYSFGRSQSYLLGLCLSVILLGCFNPEVFVLFGSVIVCGLL